MKNAKEGSFFDYEFISFQLIYIKKNIINAPPEAKKTLE